MHPISIPQESVFWLIDTHKSHPQLTSNLETDVVIVGGGLTGMTAAQKFHEQGLSVVLLEQYHCGSGASGKSSGFITPNAELGLTHFVKTYGLTKATQIWRFISSGAEQIEHTIRAHNIECGYVQEDSLMVATSKKGFTELTEEYHNFEKIKYQSELYTHQELSTHIGSSKYYGGMRFAATFGINTFAYLQALKEVLQKSGVTIYENTPVINIKSHAVETLNATVKARYIIVCVDRLAPELGIATNKIFQVQTFLMVSRPLEQSTVQTLFPDKRYMVWDTDLVYQYYRLTADNRLLLGGSTPFHSFVYQESCHPHGVYKKLTNYLHAHFPNVNVSFEYMSRINRHQ
jgi:gamma-glutamylputrescine oxidase